MAQITMHGSKYGEPLKKSWHKLLCMLNHIMSHMKCKVVGIFLFSI